MFLEKSEENGDYLFMVERRNTIQRELVLNAVRAMGCHATAEEIFNKIAEEYPTISKGTVYRNLKILAESGSIKRVEVPGAADCYDHITSNHYHVRCIKCGRVFDVDMDEISDISEKIKDKRGFSFLDFDIVFKGICPKCSDLKKLD